MTSEEIQLAIEGLLAVQKELQASQVKFTGDMIEIKESIIEQSKQIAELKENGERNDRRISLLINNSFDREQDYLNILERIIRVERRILEQNQ